MTSDSRNELGGMTRIIVGAFYVCFGLEKVGQPIVEGMCVSSCATHRRKLVWGSVIIMMVPHRLIECGGRRSEGKTPRKDFADRSVHWICTVSIRSL
jgi:hypothetical protein